FPSLGEVAWRAQAAAPVCVSRALERENEEPGPAALGACVGTRRTMPPVRQRLPLHRGRECRIGFEQVQRRRITLLVVIIGLALPASVHSALSPPARASAFPR